MVLPLGLQTHARRRAARKKRFEEAGFPCLILDGDGCDRSHGGEGQMATRIEAFIEMLGQDKEAVDL